MSRFASSVWYPMCMRTMLALTTALACQLTPSPTGWVTHESGAEAYWERPPIVYVDASARSLEQDVRDVVEDWNELAGCEVARVLTLEEIVAARTGTVAPSIVPVIGYDPAGCEGPQCDPHTSLGVARSGAIRYAGLWIPYGEYHEDVLRHIIAHEVGHVLGLSHSTDKLDLMYEEVGGADDVASRRAPAAEGAMLGARYCSVTGA